MKQVWDCVGDYSVSEPMPDLVAKIALDARGGPKKGYILTEAKEETASAEEPPKQADLFA